MSLLDRLTEIGEDSNKIGLHGFISALHEYARGGLSKGDVASNYSIAGDDNQAQAILTLIDNESTVNSKLQKAMEIGDILILHEGQDSRALYPDKASIATRLGV